MFQNALDDSSVISDCWMRHSLSWSDYRRLLKCRRSRTHSRDLMPW